MPESKIHNVLVIAEAGVNHDGNMEQALKLVDVAADAGADLVKFQTFDASALATANAALAEYQEKASGAPSQADAAGQLAMLKQLQLSEQDHIELIAHCEDRGIGFFSTAFDLRSLDFLADIGAKRFKVPSGEITNLPYLRRIASFRKEIIMSTGMADLKEIGEAIGCLEAAGLPKDKITLLHCTTEYPAPIEEVNLRAMSAMGGTFGVAVGYSDHTDGIDVAIAAVAMGASVIEKHFTLDRNLPGPDHRASLEPSALKEMIGSVRRIESALGSEHKQCTASERKNIMLVRKSIVAARAIQKDEVLSEESLTVKRPASGLSPMMWDDVIGKRASRSFKPDEVIEL
ncbi:MAG: N-acetylneuraminate synthase [Luminiphilus sp.]|jgi:N,N'-diacetyllegionaminate synthase|nr:N-acetylneuraminate synthase [Luminiphilus sp.]